MTGHDGHLKPGDERDAGDRATDQPERRGLGSHWLMIACCIPMLAIAALIAATGAGWGFFAAAVACTVMMAAMMGAMSGGDGRGG